MGMVALAQRIASAFVVFSRRHGAVSRRAQERCVSRQRLYRESAWVVAQLAGTAWQQEKQRLQRRLEELEQQHEELQRKLAGAVVLDARKQAELASVGQAIGVSLPQIRELLEVLQPSQAPSVATLGRWTRAAGRRAGALLKVWDAYACRRVRQALADEIYVCDPVLMVVEPESLYWATGRLRKRSELTGSAWAQEFQALPQLDELIADAGVSLHGGLGELNIQRQAQGMAPVAEQLDHFHILREGGRVVAGLEKKARGLLARAAKMQARWARGRRHGQRRLIDLSNRARAAQKRADGAVQHWAEQGQLWEKVKQALPLITPEGELNTRARAEAVLAETLPQLSESFARSKRFLQQKRIFTYLDRVHRQLQALPVPESIRQAAVRQETLRRRPELLGTGQRQAVVLQGILLACAVVLQKAGSVGEQALEGVRTIFRQARRASSLVESINSALRMQQARHRKMTQGLLDLKRLYWNCHRFRTGPRRGHCPYELLAIPWPGTEHWWEILKWSPEQLTQKLSANHLAA
jgi:hypothetical protein